MKDDQLAEARENCNRDPIHIPGAIQNAGVLLAADRGFVTITHASANAQRLFGRAAEALVGGAASQVLPDMVLHAARNVLGYDTIEVQRALLPGWSHEGTAYQVAVHRRGARSLVEFIPERRAAAERMVPMDHAAAFVSVPMQMSDIDGFFEEATERMRAILGFDRVKFYRFLPDGSGAVVAEARHPAMESFLGQRFPASDIPRIARELYAKTPIRMICDVLGEDLPVLGLEGAEPLDMSLAVLRGKDKIHRQYLVNMGVNATLTVPVVIDGALWGLFAAHNRRAMAPDPTALAAAELAGKVIGMRLQAALEGRRQARLNESTALVSRLIAGDDSEMSVGGNWHQHKETARRLVQCDGVAFFCGDVAHTYGAVPDALAMAALIAACDPAGDKVQAYDDVQERFPGANWADIGGALVIAAPGDPGIRLIYFRNVARNEVTWAGRPEKEIVQTQEGFRLSPRTSFEEYIEYIGDRCDPWTADDLEFASQMQIAIEAAVATQSELRENRNLMGLMVRELNHRVRNILSLVQSLSQHSKADATSVEAYAEALETRILALAGAHNLLTRSRMAGALVCDLVSLELRPFTGLGARASVSGPAVKVRPDAASVLALLFHELTSNAAKYGALANTGGRVEVSWARERGGLAIRWLERGGPVVAPPERSGFGRSIIEGAVPYEFRGEAEISFSPKGVEARFWLPEEVISDAHTGEDVPVSLPPAPGPVSGAEGAPAQLEAALVVEDNFVVALLARSLLLEYGFKAVETVGSVEDALELLGKRRFDACILDVNLQGKLVTPVAELLSEAKVPFVFATGYGSEGSELVEAFDVPLIPKPIDAVVLGAALDGVLG